MKMAAPVKTAAEYVPETRSIPQLAKAVQSCRGCDLYKRATQAVFGEGPRAARIVLIGEQPGDQEDIQGHPFVGPAGKLLDRALADAGIDRADVYVTNAVKHFKFLERGNMSNSSPISRKFALCARREPKGYSLKTVRQNPWSLRSLTVAAL